MKRLIILFLALIITGLVLSACRAAHGGCAAYGGEAKKYKIDRVH